MNDKQEAKFRELTGQPVGHLVCKMAAPTIISMMVTACYNMVDTYFVGQLHSNSATGAVGVVFSLMAIIQAIGFFFGQGSGNYISRQLGAHNFEDASKMSATGFVSAFVLGLGILVVGFLFTNPLLRIMGSTETILPYARSYMRIILIGAPYMTASLVLNNQLRFQGSAFCSMIGITTGAVLNIVLDPLFIFVLDMGQPVKIDGMDRQLIRLSGYEPDVDIPIIYTGLRPGEKLYEELLMDEEGLRETANQLIHIGQPIDMDDEAFCRQLAVLERACQSNSPDIRQYVADMVPTYHPKTDQRA